MTRRGISGLPYPAERYRPDLAICTDQRFEFETDAFSRKEDTKCRVRGLCRAASMAVNPENRKAALELADRLDYGDEEAPKTLASSLYMRGQRIRVVGALWELADLRQFGEPSTVTISPRSLEIPATRLQPVDPRNLKAILRTDLYNCGAKDADGYLAAFLDAEHEPSTDTLRFHWHGLAAGGMLEVIERLRRLSNYQSTEPRTGHRKKVPRIVVSRKPLANLPAPLTYRLKSFYSSRWEGQIDGQQRRQNGKKRISEPRHSQVLLWLDRWRLEDITLLKGLRVHTDGYHLTKTKTYTNGEVK